MGNDAEVKLQVITDDTKANASMDKLEKQADNLSKKFKDVGTKMTLGITTPIVGLLGTGIKYNSEMEQYQAGLETMLGSTEKANKMLSTLKTMASKTPFETTDLIKASQTMLSFGLDANKTTDYLQMLGDVSMGNKEKLGSLALSFSQVQSTGRLMGQDLLQMIGQGFNPLQIISEKTGRSMADLKKDMENGAISADMVTEAFKIATSEGGRFFGAMDKQSQTTEGKISTLKDGFMTAAGTLTESLLPTLTTFVTKLTELFNWFSQLDPSTQQFILSVLGIIAVVGPLLLLVGNLISAIKLVGGALTFLGANPIVLIIMGIIAVIILLIANFDKVKTVIGILGNVFMNIFYAIGGVATSVFKGIVNTIIGAINVVTRVLNAFFAGVLAPFNAIIWGLNQVPGVSLPYLNLSIPKIPYLDVGTNMVQKEGIAYLHEGEAVVPKKYNPAIGGTSSNQSIVVYSPDIIMDGRKVSNATAPYIARTFKLAGARS